jgi:hypothetical protein
MDTMCLDATTSRSATAVAHARETTREPPRAGRLRSVRCGKPDFVRGVRQRVTIWTEVRVRLRA